MTLIKLRLYCRCGGSFRADGDDTPVSSRAKEWLDLHAACVVREAPAVTVGTVGHCGLYGRGGNGCTGLDTAPAVLRSGISGCAGGAGGAGSAGCMPGSAGGGDGGRVRILDRPDTVIVQPFGAKKIDSPAKS